MFDLFDSDRYCCDVYILDINYYCCVRYIVICLVSYCCVDSVYFI